MHYKAIFLIISSDDLEVYSQMRNIFRKYSCHYEKHFKYFFIQNRNQTEEVVEENDFLYFSGTESLIPAIYQKSLKAIQYIYKKYSYDFVIRTNLSSFWHMDNVLQYLDKLPRYGFAGGFQCEYFISGTGIILSKDVGNSLTFQLDHSESLYTPDDVMISIVIQYLGFQLSFVKDYEWNYSASNENFTTIDKDFSKVLSFRIKNIDDRNVDITNMKLLLKKIYNIDYNEFVE